MRFLAVAALSVALLAGLGVLWVEESRGASQHKFMRLPDRTDNNPYSNAVLVGDTLYLAGDIGIDPETGAPPPKIEDEVRIVMDSMKTRLEMVGMSMDDLVMVEVHCPDLSLYSQFNDVYRSYFSDHFPARAFLGSGPLLLDGNFEVTGVAVRQ
jgi:enamine deaminase RidA (YjgF/YER057c/UK114 family)